MKAYKNNNTYKLPTKVNRTYYKYQDTSWTQPTLSSNGTIGGNSFACFAGSFAGSYQPYYAFDGSTTTAWCSNSTNTADFIGFYNPKPLLVTNIHCYNYQWITGKWEVYGSNDNEYYELLATGVNQYNTNGSRFNMELNSNTKAFKYYKIQCLTTLAAQRVGFGELTITAKERVTVNGSASNHDFYEDKVTYYGIGG